MEEESNSASVSADSGPLASGAAIMTMTMDHPAATIRPERRNDLECQASAGRFLTELIGAAPDDLIWDGKHHLQGHARCAGREIIVIASRDEAHRPVVLTVEDWDTIRHSFGCDRGQLLRTSAIESHNRFMQVLAAA
jgi:hypothetical protein